MIERNFKKFLKELVNAEFKDNLLAQVLVRYWGTLEISTEPRKIFDTLVPLVKANISGIEQLPQRELDSHIGETGKSPILEKKDFRISSILLSSIRGIEDRPDEVPFGIDLMDDNSNVPLNAIIVGNNGAGKTSIFSALEYIYTNEISEAKFREYGKGDESYSNYLKRTNSTHAPYSEIQIVDGDSYYLDNKIADIQNFRDLALPQTSFVSEFDVHDYETVDLSGNDEAFHNRIAGLLGFKDYVEFFEYLSVLDKRGRVKEDKDFRRNEDAIHMHSTNVEEWRRELINLKNQLDESKIEYLLEQNQKYLETLEVRRDEIIEGIQIDDLIKEWNEFVSLYTKYQSIQSDILDKEERQFLKMGLNLISKERDCPFCNYSKLEVEAIMSDVKSRLGRADKIAEIDTALTESYDRILSFLNSFISTIARYERVLSTDIVELSGMSLLDELIRSEKKLLNNPVFSDLDEIRGELNQFKDLSPFDALAKEQLHNFLIERGFFFFENSLVDEIGKFRIVREKKINEEIAKLKKESGDLGNGGETTDRRFRKKELENKIKDSKMEISDLERKRIALRKGVEAVQKIKKNVFPLLKRIDNEIQKILTEVINPLKDTLGKALGVFVDAGKEGVVVKVDLKSIKDTKSDDEKKRFSIELVDKNKKSIDPKKYFNSFRYKIFCGTIAIAIALASRKNTGINLPLILDDEFFASDIINRSEFENYFKQIILMYKEITPDLPFQFILFTHDELIFESAREAVKNVWKEFESSEGAKDHLDGFRKSSLSEKTKFARLFPSSERENGPRIMKNGKEYWNLLFDFNQGRD